MLARVSSSTKPSRTKLGDQTPMSHTHSHEQQRLHLYPPKGKVGKESIQQVGIYLQMLCPQQRVGVK